MTIGGHDTILPVPFSSDSRGVILGYFRYRWPDGIYEDATRPHTCPISEAWCCAPYSRHFFVYPSPAEKASWDANGAPVEDVSGMIQIIGDDKEITIVHGSADAPLVAELRKALEVNVLLR